jgi:glycosyltransferase involved in cell wall biosynthesis/ubiquinone/menaquinone biosynthesis C-methylase UbiE
MTTLVSKSVLLEAELLERSSAWLGHIPFAFWIIEQVQPRILVELGTHYGHSYFSFCQSVRANGLSTKCYAVDTWQGDEHTGFYGEEVFNYVEAQNQREYHAFSRLLRMRFDDALSCFSDGTIDLLHIDGLHTYEAVRHDFETWLPKLSSRGVVLFHDINVRERGFGVWRLWEELSTRYPHIEFEHSYGLGVLFVGDIQPSGITELLKEWSAPGGRYLVKYFFAKLGHLVGLEYQAQGHNQAIAERDSQIISLSQTVAEREAQIIPLNQAIAERDSQIISLSQTVAEREAQIIPLNQAIAERDSQIISLSQTVAEREAQIIPLNQAIAERDERIAAILSSRSWRLTRPLRWLGNQLRRMRMWVRFLPHALYALLFASKRFDREWYLKQNPDVATSGIDPYKHYILFGKKEGRRPAPDEFLLQSSKSGVYHLLKITPQIITQKGGIWRTCAAVLRVYRREGLAGIKCRIRQFQTGSPSKSTITITDLSSAYSKRRPVTPQSDEMVPLMNLPLLVNPPVKLIAFYLPQFHPIPENDEWWGKGFTEWTNVVRAVPQFVGHYQPRLPGELGFYDLRVPEVMRRQVELAKLYGIGAFCFYVYWFGGRRLLERPIMNYINDPSLDFPFCLCWANENWSRRWDGLDKDILIAQRHSAEDDVAFIEHVAQFMKDPRYLRVGGRPLLLVYRPSLLPSARETAARWRNWCQKHGIGEIFLAYTQSFEVVDPAEYGFDAAVEFLPNLFPSPIITDQVKLLNPNFSGVVRDWRSLIERSRAYTSPSYRLFRCVNPSWDNEARKIGRGIVFYGSSPSGYREWLTNAALDTVRRFDRDDERLVFINAWNEWAEGAYLEPDQRYGYAYLQATRDALGAVAKDREKRIVFVTHDAHPHGAQYNALNMARVLTCDLGFMVDVVVLGEGLLKPEFARYGQLHELAGVDPEGKQARSLAARLYAEGARTAICNTAVSGLFLSTLKRAGFRCVSLIHELPGIIRSYRLEEHISRIAAEADVVVFAAEMVRAGFQEFADVPTERVRIRPQGLYKRNRFAHQDGERGKARLALRSALGLSESAKIVLGVGYADHRKGIDLFVQAGIRIMQTRSDVVFVWVGHNGSDIWPQVMRIVEQSGHADRFLFPGRVPLTDIDPYYAGADVFALTSREDPFPSVVLESLEVGVPVVAFTGTGGHCDLIKQGCGLIAPAFDVDAYAARVLELLDNVAHVRSLGAEGAGRIREDFSFRHYLYDIVDWLGEPLHRVSVIVPNYNYSRYLRERLESIAKQTYPIFEIIFLDDASTDDSVSVAREILSSLNVDVRITVNTENSGSVFKQWRKGVELARGELVWIAEADDLADPRFLQTLVSFYEDHSVVLAYCQSKQMAADGTILCEHYLDYTRDISSDKWSKPYTEEGLTEIQTALAVKNTIPNVSAVLFSKDALLAALTTTDQELLNYRVAGDWVAYIEMLKRGRIAFTPTALNSHRRHQSGVTIGSFDISQLREIVRVQRKVQCEFRVNNKTRELADSYAQRLFVDFGLASRSTNNYRQHPVIASELEPEELCPICGLTQFVIEGEWLRDQYRCSRCHSIPRQRALIYVLETEFPHWRKLKIHESSPCGPTFDKLRTECADYSSSHFFPDVPPGQFRGNIRCENLERLTFPDHSFDIFITQDVLEHVLDPAAAFREISRVLRPGGAHVFTVPLYRRDKSVARARRKMEEVEHLMPPEYHGNPIDSSGSLVVTEFGRDMLQFIRDTTGMHTDVFSPKNRKNGLDGEFLDVFVCRFEESQGHCSTEVPSISQDTFVAESKRFDHETGRSMLEKAASSFNVPHVVHTNDHIFNFVINHPGFQSDQDRINYYFRDGAKSAQQLNALLEEYMPTDKKIHLLEFASGYGCVSRHLKKYQNIRLTACDIHADAVSFMESELGISTILSHSQPELLTLPEQYDIVFALSFFPHMPITTWARWLVRLVDATLPGGLIIFTTHGVHCRKLFGDPVINELDFYFRHASEQKDLPFEEYGSTITLPKFVQGVVATIRQVETVLVRQGYWWEHQDLYVLRKREGGDKSWKHAASPFNAAHAVHRDELVPPVHMIFNGTTSQEEFVRTGDGFTRYFLIDHACLRPDERVLDMGCGIGQKARALAKYLSSTGSYEGIDIVASGIDWCRKQYARYPNFNFKLADIYSAHYNPSGKYRAYEYKFPYSDQEFDLVFLSSVFTHMLPRDMENYFTEISRVLKPGGRCVITFFLLNPESLRCIGAGLNSIKVPLRYECEAEMCLIAKKESPETTVAHEERYVRSLYDRNGLSIVESTYGSWCGRRDIVGCIQDVIIAVKE